MFSVSGQHIINVRGEERRTQTLYSCDPYPDFFLFKVLFIYLQRLILGSGEILTKCRQQTQPQLPDSTLHHSDIQMSASSSASLMGWEWEGACNWSWPQTVKGERRNCSYFGVQKGAVILVQFSGQRPGGGYWVEKVRRQQGSTARVCLKVLDRLAGVS